MTSYEMSFWGLPSDGDDNVSDLGRMGCVLFDQHKKAKGRYLAYINEDILSTVDRRCQRNRGCEMIPMKRVGP